ncbi:branched-chain amino acid ABC transporter substrate-binding protein, partial [Methylobacterium sp. IIF4SW-B5]|nr:branched-chain amino acid ABC transporter substrate-binding protein [Methylobacterium ajmalii]
MTRTRAVAALWLAIGALVTGAGPARADVTVGVAVPRTGAVA